MRILLLLILVLSIAVLGTAVVARVSVRTEQVDMKAELLHSLQSGNPPVAELVEIHFIRMARFQDHWGTVSVLAVVSGFAALVCFGLTFERRAKAGAKELLQPTSAAPRD